MLPWLACLVSFVIFWYSLSWWRNRSEIGRFYNKIPTVPGLPILGNAADLRSTDVIWKSLLRYSETYGDLVKINIGPLRQMIVLTNYKLVEFILSSMEMITKSSDYKYIYPWLGMGLLNSTGTKWKQRRRMLTPAFHFKILEQSIEVFDKKSDVLVEKLDENLCGNLDVHPLVTLCTLDVICETAMGISVNLQNNSHTEYVWGVDEMTRIIVERFTSPIQRHDFLFRFTKNYSIQKRALRLLHEFTLNIIRQRKREIDENLNVKNNDDDDTIGTKRKQCFLDLLLKSTIDGQPLSDEDIREEVDTFMFAGHDTTASAISFALYCLAHNPDVQKRAYEEQQEIFEDLSTTTIKYQDLSQMKYLELVIKETLRLFPTAPFILRETDRKFQFGDLTIPEGVVFLISILGIHRNPKYYPNPDRFDPERFDNTDCKLPYSFIPFSAGPRNCIGQRFAMFEMKTVLSKIIRRFELVPSVPEHRLKLANEMILKSLNGIRIGIKRRQ